MRPLTEEEAQQQSVRDRCTQILHEFDTWLAVRVLWMRLKHEELPQLNDAFRDYFSDTRSARSPGGSL